MKTKKGKQKAIKLQKEGKTTGEINITLQIDKKIRKKMPLDGTPSVDLAAPIAFGGFAAACLIRVQQLATQRTFYKEFVQVCLLPVAPCHLSQRPSGAAGTPLGC